MKNDDALCVQEHDVSQIEDTNRIGSLFRASSGSEPKSENEKEITDRNDIKEGRAKCLEERNNDVNILEEQVGDCHDVRNLELGEVQVNNDLDENQPE